MLLSYIYYKDLHTHLIGQHKEGKFSKNTLNFLHSQIDSTWRFEFSVLISVFKTPPHLTTYIHIVNNCNVGVIHLLQGHACSPNWTTKGRKIFKKHFELYSFTNKLNLKIWIFSSTKGFQNYSPLNHLEIHSRPFRCGCHKLTSRIITLT